MFYSRKRNAIRNVKYSYLDMAITCIFTLFSRWLIVYVFGEKYLGLSSLFSSILQVLGVAELGFSSAITYNLYKPIAENDTKKVCAYLRYFRTVYRMVGIVITMIGLIVLPFVSTLIKGDVPSNINIYFLYILYLINSSIGYYFFAYKSALLDVLQRMDLLKKTNIIIGLFRCIIQVMCLLVLRNYYLFVFAQIICNILNNLLAAYVSKKHFPEYRCHGMLEVEDRKNVITRVKGILVSNISAVTYTSLDSIILSVYVGLSAVAIYGNYMSICNMLSKIIILFRRALQSGVGNSIVTETVEKNYSDMMFLQFVFSIIASWCVNCMFNLYQPFMILWMGEDKLLRMIDIVFLCAWFFVGVVQHSFYLYLAGNGLWWEMRIPYILSTVFNLLMNIVLGKMFGITGIIVSTFLASFIFGTFYQCIVLFKHYYKRSIKEYYLNQLKYIITCFIVVCLSYIICNSISNKSILICLIFRFLICNICSLMVFLIFFGKSKYTKLAITFLHDKKWRFK